jgi:hypothetical protein
MFIVICKIKSRKKISHVLVQGNGVPGPIAPATDAVLFVFQETILHDKELPEILLGTLVALHLVKQGTGIGGYFKIISSVIAHRKLFGTRFYQSK